MYRFFVTLLVAAALFYAAPLIAETDVAAYVMGAVSGVLFSIFLFTLVILCVVSRTKPSSFEYSMAAVLQTLGLVVRYFDQICVALGLVSMASMFFVHRLLQDSSPTIRFGIRLVVRLLAVYIPPICRNLPTHAAY